MSLSHIIVAKTIAIQYSDRGLPAYPMRVNIHDDNDSEILIAVIDKKYMDCVRRVLRDLCIQFVGEAKAKECVENKLIEVDRVEIEVRNDVVIVETEKDGNNAGFAMKYKTVTWSHAEVVCEDEEKKIEANYL